MSRFRRESLVLGLSLLGLLAGRRAEAAAKYTITEVPNLPGYQNSVLTGINNSGQIVGVASNPNTVDASGAREGFLVTNGVTTTIPVGASVHSVGINNLGQTYTSPDSNGTPDNQINNVGQQISGQTLISGGQTISLGDFHASSINDLGVIAGAIQAADFNNHSAIYQNGQVSDMASTLGLSNATSSAIGINNRGDLLLEYRQQGQGWTHAVHYADGHTQVFATAMASALNNVGQVVGGDFLMNSNGTTSTLESLLPPSAQSLWYGLQANAINDSGQIVGGGMMSDGKWHEFLMTPVPTPEPTTLAFLLVTAAGCVKKTRYQFSIIEERKLGVSSQTSRRIEN